MSSLRKPWPHLRDWHSWSPLRLRGRWPGRTSFPRSDSSRCSAPIRFGTPALAGSATPMPCPSGDDVPGGGSYLYNGAKWRPNFCLVTRLAQHPSRPRPTTSEPPLFSGPFGSC